jgi:hypothetical protein
MVSSQNYIYPKPFVGTCHIRHTGLRSKLLSTLPSDVKKLSTMDNAFTLLLGHTFTGKDDKVCLEK